ncbi:MULTISPECIES: carbohydrate ABC transporter permease [Actinomadura]|uniref:ABC transporter permease subunit n=1 Tax=Actinomadura litoris TaxID=2678616 RepID=A0A7K1L1E3_9ACTN|nr:MULTISPECIES: sugar ABC transporter permease [Actinomadura]MBT2206622.1 sugar ABC transporter permease [Actinomadura sp. NEAU-AAG7]MUN38278.1 ABC transporter permease subunit [Actinomadura litoris]
MAAVQSAPAATKRRAGRAELSDRSRSERRLGLLLSAPAVIVMLLVTAYPLLNALYLSLFRYRITAPDDKKFVGLSNYWTALSDPLFWQNVFTTFIITFATVAVELVIGFGLAMVMHRALFARRTVRTAILLPYGIVTVISAFAWRYAFDLQSGFVNSWFGLGDYAWFSGRWSSLFVIVLSEIWKTTPFVSLLLLAGLAQVPNDLGEAATVDGATAWQRLRRVTIPNMKAAILVAVLFRTLDAWRIFDNVYIMTSGQQKTQTLSFLTYQQTITRTAIGLGDAVGVLLFLSVVLIAVVFIRGFRVDLSQVRGDR